MAHVLEWMTEDQWSYFAITLWAIWRCRNGKVYQGQQQSISQFVKYATLIKRETILVKSCSSTILGDAITNVAIRSKWLCFTDASWVDSWYTGTGFFLKDGEQLLAYGIQYTFSSCPLQAEAKALLTALTYVQDRGLQECTFCTDNLVLV